MTREQSIAHLSRGMCGAHKLAADGCSTCERTVEALATLERLAWERGVGAARDVLTRSDSLSAAIEVRRSAVRAGAGGAAVTSVYIAGPSAELARVRATADLLAAVDSIEIVGRWWERIEADRDGRPTDDGVPFAVRAAAWERNAAAIEEADCVVALVRTGGGLSDGTREEIAYALGLGKYVDIIGDPAPSLAGTACDVWDSVPHYVRAQHTAGVP